MQRYGKVRKFSVATRQLTTLATLPVVVEVRDGVTGIVLEPDFKVYRWVYLFYGHGTQGDFRHRLSRFTLDGFGMLDMASERPILIIPARKGRFHTAGAMRFDA